MNLKKPIFIVGCGRSGTTILFDTLSLNPVISRTTGYPDGEDHEGWIEHGDCVIAGIGNNKSDKYGDGINGFNYCLHMTEEDATENIISRMRKHYWSNVLCCNENKRVLTKQPHLSNKLGYLLKIFPDAKIVHIVRDCPSVVASWITVMEEHPSLVAFMPDDEFPCLWLFPMPKKENQKKVLVRNSSVYPGEGELLWVKYWIKVNGGIEKQMLGKEDQLHVVRYEDFVMEPRLTVNKICDFCEIQLFSFPCDGINKDTEHKYKHLLSEKVIQQINIDAYDLRERFGYV